MGGQGRIEVVCDGAGSLQLPVEQRAADPLPTARGSDPSPAGDAVLLGLAALGLEPAEGHQLVTVPTEPGIGLRVGPPPRQLVRTRSHLVSLAPLVGPTHAREPTRPPRI